MVFISREGDVTPNTRAKCAFAAKRSKHTYFTCLIRPCFSLCDWLISCSVKVIFITFFLLKKIFQKSPAALFVSIYFAKAKREDRGGRRSNFWFTIHRKQFYRLERNLKAKTFPKGRYAVDIATVLTICTAVVFPIYKERSGFAGYRLSGSRKRTFCTRTIAHWDKVWQLGNVFLISEDSSSTECCVNERSRSRLKIYSSLFVSTFITFGTRKKTTVL